MSLQSQLFRGDPKLEAAAVSDPAHILPGAVGQHVAKIQQALLKLDGITIDPGELQSSRYGPSTANAVLAYKKKRNIINRSYQTQADNIVGKMTIAALDKELVGKQGPPTLPDPLANPAESVRIQALLVKERPGVRRMIETTLQSLDEVQTAFQVFHEDPARSNSLELKNLLTIDGLQRFFSVNRFNHQLFLPKIIQQFNSYLRSFPRLSNDQRSADFPTLVRDFPDELENGKLTGKTPPAFSDAPRAMFFTPRYREFDPGMPDIFKGFFSETLQGIQLHEMGHFYFAFDDGDPKGKPPQVSLRLAASYDLLARQATFKRRM
jgi:hypothetical protein